MALTDDIKKYINKEWSPKREELGLKGLIEVAARGAEIAVEGQLEASAARTEELEDRIHAFENLGTEESEDSDDEIDALVEQGITGDVPNPDA